jgi:hypothetical protein
MFSGFHRDAGRTDFFRLSYGNIFYESIRIENSCNHSVMSGRKERFWTSQNDNKREEQENCHSRLSSRCIGIL